ncbi:MAG: glycogen synthase [Saprospiraceae bacterium]|nr:glycogen synthase [Saprospiraceae bacterium]MCB0591603.1 glycogen synthase [Saprospiraceae bacterium]MCC7150326.1 glycogen synthase [Saprospiraceae bacterium]MCO6471579.1 glycogen synthase [Saprospiraceae bacterium]HMY84652.1 glycogen/starch synthase [Saprospiraceae bacterium]
MKVLHVAAECYPAAKAGGLGDVVGALPKYLNRIGMQAGVIIPKYGTKWLWEHQFKTIFTGTVRLNRSYIRYSIEQEVDDILGFTLFAVHVPGMFDRPGVYADPTTGYGYSDELERYLVFQQAVLQWLISSAERPNVIHCHDHHTALIPFMTNYCPEYESLAYIPKVLTIHNGVYQGIFSWNNKDLLPYFRTYAAPILDWNGMINSLATGIKCAWRVTTVSYSYMEELSNKSNGLESLIRSEWHKCRGILNGIDNETWNPATDPRIAYKLKKDVRSFKSYNKLVISEKFRINPNLPLIVFIGRLVAEKGADLLPDLIFRCAQSGRKVSFVVLGTGDRNLHQSFRHLQWHLQGMFDCSLEYNETLAHQLYAGADFILMPSRVEPCGLNQMYAMRYGTVPIVRAVGGLIDTVWDHGDWEGRGFRFQQFTLDDALHAIDRAISVFHDQKEFARLQAHDMALDFSWDSAAHNYLNLYKELT